jgi:hypothetical protein
MGEIRTAYRNSTGNLKGRTSWQSYETVGKEALMGSNGEG